MYVRGEKTHVQGQQSACLEPAEKGSAGGVLFRSVRELAGEAGEEFHH
jgi:hypothetical protein